jgi:molybdopterin converting factor small subunit
MKIAVQYTTQLRSALGVPQQHVTIDEGSTLGQLLHHLADQHPTAFAAFVLDDDGQLLPNVMVCVGDQHVVQPQKHVLENGATVTILSAISGG